MKLSQMRNCDSCAKSLIHAGIFYVVRTSTAFISPRAMQQTAGVVSILGGIHALSIAEALSPDPDVVVITGDEDPRLITEMFLCPDCYMGCDPLMNAYANVEAIDSTTEN